MKILSTSRTGVARLMMKSSTRGGARLGAGRKKKDTEAIQIRVPAEVAATIRARAKDRGCTLGQIIEEWIKSEA